MPTSISSDFTAFSRMADSLSDNSSLVVKNGGFAAQGRVGTFFTLKSTNRQAGDALFSVVRQKYGNTVADALAPRLRSVREEGRPLSARIVRDVLHSAADMADGLSRINADMARHFVLGNTGPGDTRNIAHAFNEFCAANGMDPAAHQSLMAEFGKAVIRAATAENGRVMSYEDLSAMVRTASTPDLKRAWNEVRAGAFLASPATHAAVSALADSLNLDAAQRQQLGRVVNMTVHHEAELAADGNRVFDDQAMLRRIADGSLEEGKNFAFACGKNVEVSPMAQDAMVWTTPATAADMAVVTSRFSGSGMGCVALISQRLGEMRALQPDGLLTRETIWQGCFHEPMPGERKYESLRDFNDAMFARLAAVFEQAKPGDLTASTMGMTALSSGVTLEKAEAGLRGPVSLSIDDFVNRPTLTPPGLLGTLDQVEASLAKDLNRRGTSGALPGYSPIVTFGVPGGPVDTVNIHDTSAFTEEELARFNVGSTSPVSAELARRAVALCNGNDVQARQVILSMGQSGAFLVRSNSHFTGIYQSEHSPLDIDVRREENGNVTMRFYKPAASPLDMDYTYTITPDGRGTLTACRIQARAPQTAAAGN